MVLCESFGHLTSVLKTCRLGVLTALFNCSFVANIPHLHQAAGAIQKVPMQLVLSALLQDEAAAVQARLP